MLPAREVEFAPEIRVARGSDPLPRPSVELGCYLDDKIWAAIASVPIHRMGPSGDK
jgi:hypothetical protein